MFGNAELLLPLFIPFHSVASYEERKLFMQFSLRGKCLLHWTWENFYFILFFSLVMCVSLHWITFWPCCSWDIVLCNFLYSAIYIFTVVSFYSPLPWYKKIISLAFCFQPSLVLSKPVQLWIVSWQCLSHYFNLWEVFLHMPVLGEGGCFFILLQAAPVGTEKLLKECMIWWEHTGEHKEK